jgi:hypothetical protein
MEFLSDRLFVALAKRAGFPELSELKRCRDLQIDWIRNGTPATLFVVSQIEGVITTEQTVQFEGWARDAIAQSPGSAAIREQDHSPTEEVEVGHAFQQPAKPEPEDEDTFEPWIPDRDLLDDADSVGSEDSLEDDDLELLPDDGDADMNALGRAGPRVIDGSGLRFIAEDEATGEVFCVLASREFDAYKHAPSGETVFPDSEHTELFEDDEPELGFEDGDDPLADILAVLDGRDKPVRRTPSTQVSLLDGLLDVCEDSDDPPPSRFEMDAHSPQTRADKSESRCEDGLVLRAQKRTRRLTGSSETRTALRTRPKIKRKGRRAISRWKT